VIYCLGMQRSSVLCAILCVCLCTVSSAQTNKPERIVSMAPSITETIYALGLGEQLIGVTDYCMYPPEVETKERIGDLYHPNIERIIRLKPDLVIMLPASIDSKSLLEQLGIICLVVQQESVDDAAESMQQIGKACGVPDVAAIHANILRMALRSPVNLTPDVARPRVLVVVGHEAGGSGFRQLYVAGKDGFYDRLLDLAGAENAYDGSIKYPQLSREGLLRLNPDLLIDIVPDLTTRGLDEEALLAAWKLTQQHGIEQRVVVLSKDYVAIPGPRLPLLLNDFKRIVNGHE